MQFFLITQFDRFAQIDLGIFNAIFVERLEGAHIRSRCPETVRTFQNKAPRRENFVQKCLIGGEHGRYHDAKCACNTNANVAFTKSYHDNANCQGEV